MKRTMVYEWQSGSRIKLDPEAAGKQLEAIKKRSRGMLTPAAVLMDARPKKSLLHDYFEWDDGKAAEHYREQQAGYLIRSLVVRVVEVKGKSAARGPVRAFVSVQANDKRGYVGVVEALSNTKMREQVLNNAMTELQGWRQRYNDLSEFSKIFRAIDNVQGDLGLAA